MPKFEDPWIRQRQERKLESYLGPSELIITSIKGFLGLISKQDVAKEKSRCGVGRVGDIDV